MVRQEVQERSCLSMSESETTANQTIEVKGHRLEIYEYNGYMFS